MTPDAAGTDRRPQPTGYHLLLPPGWRGFQVDDAGRAEIEGLLRGRLAQVGRPALEAQLRQLLREHWDGLLRQGARQVLMPVESEQAVLPMSIVVRQLVARAGSDFAATVAAITGAQLECFDTAMGPIYRSRTVTEGRDALSDVQSTTIMIALPLPEPHHDKGLVFIAGVTHPRDAAGDLVDGHVELLDSIMETVRWR